VSHALCFVSPFNFSLFQLHLKGIGHSPKKKLMLSGDQRRSQRMNTSKLFPIYQGLFRFHFVIHISTNCFVCVLMIFLKCQMLIC